MKYFLIRKLLGWDAVEPFRELEGRWGTNSLRTVARKAIFTSVNFERHLKTPAKPGKVKA